MLKLRELVENKLRVTGSSLTSGFCCRFKAAFAIARITPSGESVKIACVILFVGECEMNLIMCLTFFNSLQTLFDFDLLIGLEIYFIWRRWLRTFIHFFFIAIHRRQLSAKYICPKSKYRIALRAGINDNVSERSYDGIRTCIYMTVRVFRKNLTGHCPELTLVSKVTEHNRIVAV